MRIQNESELLKIEVRKQIIDEIASRENQSRKYEAYKRYQCFKDKTSHYVIELLLRQFDSDTVQEMRYALSNISIVKKVVGKLARVYSNGVDRSISDDDVATENLKKIEKLLDINSAMKKVNRFLKLQKNVDLFIKPCPVIELGKPVKWTVKAEVLSPYLYDVVEDYHDRTKSLCVILSDYQPPATSLSLFDGSRAPLPLPTAADPTTKKPDGVDQKIADSAIDQRLGEGKTFVFWSKNLHFTCNEKGEIIADQNNPQNKNPLGVFNHINFAIDQDGAFWAEGGDDLIDGAILINAVITHTTHVGTIQGYGQFYMTGENLPRSIKVGPTKAILAEYKLNEQAEPKLGFLSANPQLDSLRGLIEMYIALYLTTNNLSTSGVATQLSGSTSMPSGIAMVIDKSESLEDVQDQRQVFIDKEPDVFESINAALKTYSNILVDELKGIQLPDNFKQKFNIKFHDATPIMSESERLDNLKKRQELGFDSMISMMMKEDQSLTEDQAKDKLKKIIEQKIIEKLYEQEAMNSSGLEGPYDTEEDKDAEAKPEESKDAQSPDQANGTPTVGDTAKATDQNVQQQALNGAQVASLVEIVEKVAAGTLPRESAINMIILAFNVKPEDAEKILGSAGKGFKIEALAPLPQNSGALNESNKQDDGL